jgi:hypothetical protein
MTIKLKRKGLDIYNAVKNKNHEELKTLLDSPNAYLEYKNKADGNYAIHWAVLNKDIKSLQLLINAKCNLELKNKQNVTAIHIAVTLETIECLLELINKGADIHAKADFDFTPIHFACAYGKEKSLVVLLDSGANYLLTSLSGVTAMDITLTHNTCIKMMPVFIFYGVKIRTGFTDDIKKNLYLRTRILIEQYNRFITSENINSKIISKEKINKTIDKEDIFNKIKFIEIMYSKIPKNMMLYNILNNIKYVYIIIEYLEIAISEGTERMIYACLDCKNIKRLSRFNENDMKKKQYIAIKCIEKVGELKMLMSEYIKKKSGIEKYIETKRNKIEDVSKYIETELKELN